MSAESVSCTHECTKTLVHSWESEVRDVDLFHKVYESLVNSRASKSLVRTCGETFKVSP
jgi:hypothetical protein